ncbi:Uncharacterized protein FKW44_023940 [Caligus rogercresseyi]|uniref:Uncharacterized protein n=1 Tax=Caligus rogercresseyi TaxID=217165 RepID=A0A7T8GQB4_CALRO|nr:Uncharacterized protein FKW44_023940 [Caligus rogercresseyi]
MRVGESGVGMPGVNNNSIVTTKTHPLVVVPGTPLLLPSSSTTNNASYSSSATAPTQSIPTLGGPPKAPSPASGPLPPSSIAVMTHDKREYSKKVISEIDFSVPPPGIPTVGSGPPTSAYLRHPYHPRRHPPRRIPSSSPLPTRATSPPWRPNGRLPRDRDYDDRDWHNRRSSRERRDYDRKRRRSRSRSRDRYRRRRSRSKSPSYKHKKSKKEKRERKQEESSSSSSKQKESEDRND